MEIPSKIISEGLSKTEIPDKIIDKKALKGKILYYFTHPTVFPYVFSMSKLNKELNKNNLPSTKSIIPFYKNFFENDTPQYTVISEEVLKYKASNSIFVIPSGNDYEEIYRQLKHKNVDYKKYNILFLSDLIKIL